MYSPVRVSMRSISPSLMNSGTRTDGAGLELGELLTAGGGVAAQARVGLDDLELDVRRRRHQQRHAVPQRDDADDAVLEPLRGVAHGRFARLSCS